jgi:metastasis-associated protein MTA
MKTRAAFCLITTLLTRTSRQVCADILQIQRSARQPFQPINIALIKQECSNRLAEKKNIKGLVKKKRRNMNACSAKMGIDIAYNPKELEHTAVIKEPAVYAFPKGPVPPFLRASETAAAPSAAPSSTSSTASSTAASQPSILGKRGFDQSAAAASATASADPAPSKRPNIGVIRQAGNAKQIEGKHHRKVSSSMRGSVINQSNGGGRSGRAPVQRTVSSAAGGKKLSWMDAPDDVFFAATDNTRKLRKALASADFKKAARKPWRQLKGVKVLGGGSGDGVVVLD